MIDKRLFAFFRRQFRDAETGSDRTYAGVLTGRQLFPQTLGQSLSFVQRRFRRQNDKFLAAPATGNVALARLRRQHLRNRTQNLDTDGMTVSTPKQRSSWISDTSRPERNPTRSAASRATRGYWRVSRQYMG